MPPTNVLTANRDYLRQFLQSETDGLARTLRLYAWRAGLPADESSVGELLNETVVEALAHAERFDINRSPRAWLLGIAANLVRRRSAAVARLNAREPLAADLSPGSLGLSEDAVFERLAVMGHDISSEADVLLIQQIRDALGLLSAEDQKIIRLFAEGGLSGEALGQALGIRPGAARVRLHRALSRLRRLLPAGEEIDHD